MYQTPLF
jgi:hypothetical protein